MSSELVKRLRSMHWCVTTETNGVGVSDRKVALEAADRISALQAQNLRLSGMCYDLTAERDHAWAMAAKADTQMGQSLADHLQAKAERDRLREYYEAKEAFDEEKTTGNGRRCVRARAAICEAKEGR